MMAADSFYAFLLKLLLVSAAVVAPIHPLLITVGILIVTDLVTGIWAALKREERVSSAAMRRTITKFLIYQTCLITGFLFEKYLLAELVPVTKVLGGLIGVVEFKSLLENCNAILGKDLFKELIRRLGSKNDEDLK